MLEKQTQLPPSESSTLDLKVILISVFGLESSKMYSIKLNVFNLMRTTAN